MEGFKQSGSSRPSLIAALVDSVGIRKSEDGDLSKVDGSTKTFLCATIEEAPNAVLLDAASHFEAEATMSRAQAEASKIPNSSQVLSKKAAYCRMAAQALEAYVQRRGGS